MRLHCTYLSIVALLVLVIVAQHYCTRPPEQLTRVDTLYIYDSIPITPPPITPKPGRVEYVELPAIIDTVAVVREYFARRYGEDTLIDSRDLFLSLRWEVQENRPTLFQPTIINRKPTTVIAHTPVRRMDIFAGAVMQGNAASFGFAPTVLFNWDNATYSIGYDIMRGEVSGGLYWRIR